MGPITLFDKSFLQSLSTDESVWFDHFFYSVICPLFYIEVLADLEKKPRDGKTAEDEVGILADKTPQMSSAPCYFHNILTINDLLGVEVPMDGRIPMAGTRQVVRNGKLGAIISETPEAKAFTRWQQGRFMDVERQQAKAWRAHLKSLDLPALEATMKKSGVSNKTCRTLNDAFTNANAIVDTLTTSSTRFDSAMIILGLPSLARRQVKYRWNELKRPPLSAFSPYAAHVLRVQFFFNISLGANLIASTRASHHVDISYLNYLPFCQVFVSSDKLHKTCAPLFMRPNQTFVWGGDLKPDLTAINQHFLMLPNEVKAQGLYRFAKILPESVSGTIRPLMQQYTPALLKEASASVKVAPEMAKKMVDNVNAWVDAPEVAPGDQTDGMEMETLILKRAISGTRGSWVQVSPKDAGEATSPDR